MGSKKPGKRPPQQQQKETLSKGEKRKKRLSLGPKKHDYTDKTAVLKGIKSKKKKIKKDLIVDSNEIGSKSEDNRKRKEEGESGNGVVLERPAGTEAEQLKYFLHQYQSGNRVQLSALELESFKDEYMLELSQGTAQNISCLGEYMKAAFGSSWKEVLCENQLGEGKVDPGNPALLVITLSALRSLELLRELRPLTRECHAVKLFAKHMKIEEQVSLLKNRVNIACGTPSRIKKLIDMEALGLSRVAVIVLDMSTDVKGYSLFTLPQVREEFWDLYKSYFHQRLLEGGLRICLYGTIPAIPESKIEVKDG